MLVLQQEETKIAANSQGKASTERPSHVHTMPKVLPAGYTSIIHNRKKKRKTDTGTSEAE